MLQQVVAKNIALYKIFQLLREPLFWGPILIIYVQKTSGMSLSDIFIMESVAVLLLSLLQIPTGAIADKIGRKNTILIGILFEVIHVIIFIFISKPWHVWVENFFWCIGFALMSGADNAFLRDNLALVKREKEYEKIQGNAIGQRYLLIALCSLATGYLATINLRLPAILSLIPCVINLFVVYRFNEIIPRQKEENKINCIDLMKESMKFVSNHAKIKWLICFSVLFTTVSKIWFFTYNPYFELVRIPLEQFGYIFFVLNMIAAISSHCAHSITKKLPNYMSNILILSMISIPIILMSIIVHPICAWLVILQNIARGYHAPYIENIMHQYLQSYNRATVMSIQTAVNNFFQVVGMMIVSQLLTSVLGLIGTLKFMGITSLVFSMMLIVSYQKIFKTK